MIGKLKEHWFPHGDRGSRAESLHAAGFWLMLAVLAGIAAIMFTLGRTAIHAYERAQIAGVANVGSLFIEGILTPHAYELLEQPGHSKDLVAEIGGVVEKLRSARHFQAINIWSADGSLQFSSRGYQNLEAHHPHGLEQAQAGEIAAELVEDVDDGDSPVPPPFVEVYAPIYSPTDHQLVAVGEVYIDASDIIADRWRTTAAIWFSTTLAAFGLAGLTGVVAMQRRRLLERYAQLAESSAANLALLRKADAAREAAAKSNEDLLNEIGGALHDGPLQMLTLAALSSEARGTQAGPVQSSSTILQEAMSQLRQIASGLLLPELGGLSACEAVRLAVARHEGITGAQVNVQTNIPPGEVSEAIKACLYRVTQEGLANAYRHGGSMARVMVRTRVENGRVVIEVENSPWRRRGAEAPNDETRPKLGLGALSHRIGALGGTISRRDLPDGATILRAELPLGSASGQPPS